MPKLEYFIVAEAASFESYANRATLFNILNIIAPARFPAKASKMAIAAAFRFLPEDEGKTFSQNVLIEPPLGEPRLLDSSDIVASSEAQGTVIVKNVFGIPLAAPGNIIFKCLLNDEVIAQCDVSVTERDDDLEWTESLAFIYPRIQGAKPLEENSPSPKSK